jgi:GTP-binding protein
VDQTFDLFDRLGANDTQLDFPIVYASALMGYAGMEDTVREGDMTPLFQTIVDRVKAPPVDVNGGFQMQISQLDYSSYVGVIGIGRIQRGSIKTNTPVVVIDREGNKRQGRVLQILGFMGLTRVEVQEAQAGDIVAITGIEKLSISDTVCHPDFPEALPALMVDEPTISIYFCVNNSPFAGKEGKFLTSRQIRDRLMKETQTNVALRVEETEDPDKFKVSGRGELHLSILIETMRREGFEMALSRPEVIQKEVDGVLCEPFEQVVVDLDEAHQGSVISRLNERSGTMKNMENDGKGRTRLEYMMPSRGLIGFQTEFKTITGGTGLLFHVFDHYGPAVKGAIAPRPNGVMISNAAGSSPAYAQYSLQERGRLFVVPGDEIYEGQIVGIHAKDNDLTVNALRAKQLTNFRAAGKDDNLMLTPPVRFSLEQSLEFIEDDELCEVTPQSIRLRKKHLTENARVQAERGAKRA